MISAVVLAAGNGERMGKPKLFLPWRGKAVLQWVLENVLASTVNEVICVVGDLTAVLAHISLRDERLSWLVNDQTERGQSSSIIAGLWAVDTRAEGALFVAGDLPLLDSALIDALIERAKIVSAPIIAPSFEGETRNPALYRRELFPELLKLKGDRGAESVIRKSRGRVEWVHWKEEGTFLDIDDQQESARLKLLANARSFRRA
jgi:molybdenum cofactor cytidylyltransferase